MNFSNMITPDDYEEASFVTREIAKEMLSRLDWMKVHPKQVLDAGCGVGRDAEMLAQRYPQAQVWGIDLRQSFLQYAKKKKESGITWLLADSATLPLKAHSVDLIFANLLLPWIKNPAFLLREWRRILRPEGLVLFSDLGPDTFKEWTLPPEEARNAGFPYLTDMHPVGDALLEAGFTDPVLEVENLTLTYQSPEQCQRELQKSGLWAEGAGLPATSETAVTFEVIYGHAWCPAMKGFKPDDQGVVRIPVSQVKK